MNLKKLVLGLTLLALISMPAVCFAQNVSDSVVRAMVQKYKAQNYLGCLQATQDIIKKNPSNIYAHYYQALSYVQLGKKDEALSAYEKVKALNSNKTIVTYAERGIACINTPEECAKYTEQTDDLEKFINSKKFYDPSVQAEVNKKKLDRIRENINDELSTPKKSEMPSNEEIAEAVKTLAKVGFNPMTGMNSMYNNPEMMQMNMLLSNDNQSNNGLANMLPYFLMSQNQNSKISPELIQTMMMSQMPMY